jgi:hypothetical protein
VTALWRRVLARVCLAFDCATVLASLATIASGRHPAEGCFGLISGTLAAAGVRFLVYPGRGRRYARGRRSR